MATDPKLDLANALAATLSGNPGDPETMLAREKWVKGQIAASVKAGLSKADAIRKLTKDINTAYAERTELIADPFLKRNEALEDLEKTLAGARTRARGNTRADYKFEATEIHKKQKDLRGKMKRLHKETATGDPDFQRNVENSPHYKQGSQGRAQSILENLRTVNPYEGQPKGFRGQKNYPATMRAMLDAFNEEMEYDVFQFDGNGMFTNADELFGDQGRTGQTKNPGKLPGIMGLNNSDLFVGFRSDMEYYNQRQRDDNALSAELEAADTAADAALVNLNSAKTLTQMKDTNEDYQVGAVSGLSTFYEKLAEGMPTEYVDASKKQLGRLNLGIADLETELASVKRGGQAGAVSGGGGGAQSNRVRGFSNEAWLDWARDNGFDNLGYVTNGRYVEGADDDKAIILFNRQKRADPGSFRFRAARAGETVQVELNDGTRVFGERLRRHAADRGRVIRVATKDGLQEFRPGDIDRVVVLPSDGKRPQRGFSLDPEIGRRAGRIGRRRADDIDSAVGQAMPRDIGEMIGTAVTHGGDYALDGDKYVKQEAFDAARDKYVADKSLTARSVGGANYIVDGQDNVYTSDPDGKLTRIDPAGPSSDAVTSALSAPPLRLMDLAGDEARLMTMDDIVDGKLPAGFELEGSPGDYGDPGDYDKLAQAYRNSVSPENLGFKSTSDRPDPFAGQTVTNERVISGVTFVDLAGDEDAPDAELPEDPTAREQADADELANLARQRREQLGRGAGSGAPSSRGTKVKAYDESDVSALRNMIRPSRPLAADRELRGVAEDSKGQKTFDQSVEKANKRFDRQADRRGKIANAKEFMQRAGIALRETFPKPAEAPEEDESSGDIPTNVGDIGWNDPAQDGAGPADASVVLGRSGIPDPVGTEATSDMDEDDLDTLRSMYSPNSDLVKEHELLWNQRNE